MIRFKPLETSDIEAIIAMMEDFYAIDNYPFDAATAKVLFDAFLADDNLGRAWLILDNNAIVGYLILTFVFSFEYKGKIAFIDELYLIEEARGKGIGKAAIQFVQQETSRLALKMLYLEVENCNEKAQKLYLSQDFEYHNRKIMKYTIQQNPI
jgi:GNAT superfamily N-acetyltransferase